MILRLPAPDGRQLAIDRSALPRSFLLSIEGRGTETVSLDSCGGSGPYSAAVDLMVSFGIDFVCEFTYTLAGAIAQATENPS